MKHNTNKNTETSFHERLLYDRVTFYYISLPIAILGNLLGAVLLSAIIKDVVGIRSVIIWLTLSIVLFFYQLYHYYSFKNCSEEEKLTHADLWIDRYYTNILLNGVVWGSSAFLLFPERHLVYQVIVILFLLAITFFSINLLISKKDMLFTYTVITFVPLISHLFFMEESLYKFIAFGVILLLIFLVIFASYYNNIIDKTLQKRQRFIALTHTHEQHKKHLFILFERAPVGIYYYNKNLELQDCNNYFLNINKLRDKSEIIGFDLTKLNNPQVIKVHKEIFENKSGKYRGPLELLHTTQNLYVNLTTVPMVSNQDKVTGGIAIVNDISNEIAAKDQMVRNTYYDILTNIPNRTLFMDKLKLFLLQYNPHKTYAAVLFLDINNFKNVNKTYGHHIGDHLLKQVARRIEDLLDEKEIFARISGSKFAILLPQLDPIYQTSRTKVETYIKKINHQFLQPLDIVDNEYHLSFTIGIYLFSERNSSAFDVLKRAEVAMYESKKVAKGTYAFYEDRMSTRAQEQLLLENEIYRAIKNDSFTIAYQPQLDLKTNRLNGAEALIRWHHPIRGLISPSTFIPIAIESGSIIKLERYIFEKIFQQITQLIEELEEFSLYHIAINISIVHFLQPHFTSWLVEMTQHYHITPSWIELELNEGNITEHVDSVIDRIDELKTYGFTFAIDDFGTGHSSLMYLKELPVNRIKIDRRFVTTMNEDQGDMMIVESIISIAKNFGIKSIAEGVEDEATLKTLQKLGCDCYQGNYYYEPLDFEAFKVIL